MGVALTIKPGTRCRSPFVEHSEAKPQAEGGREGGPPGNIPQRPPELKKRKPPGHHHDVAHDLLMTVWCLILLPHIKMENLIELI